MAMSIVRLGSIVTTSFAAVFLLTACGDTELVTPTASSTDLSIQPLTGFGGLSLTPVGVKGTYGPACKVHAGEIWDLNLNDPTDNSLEVVLNDTFVNCPLTLTSITVASGGALADFPVEPPIILDLAYPASPAAASYASPSVLAFFANARLSALAGPVYTNNFAINLIYSDNALSCSNIAPPAIYAKVNAVATGSAVPPPAYDVTYDGLELVVDANQIVQPSSIGSVLLVPQGQIGEEWRMFDESTRCCNSYSFTEIDVIFNGFEPIAGGAVGGSETIALPWTSFNLLGGQLPKERTIIVKHTGEGGVYSYELIQIAFPGAY
jgi:hypothetical protein